ncbi:hypothetical protein J7E86_06770 [Streptomyces sp. ISL-11]|nr:hypothetical protein [Streptomyces sp. ISL-11]
MAEAAASEAEEEIGVRVRGLNATYVLNKVYDDGPPVIGWYFHTKEWDGTPSNREPDRCSALTWAAPPTVDLQAEWTDRLAVQEWMKGAVAGRMWPGGAGNGPAPAPTR